MEQPTHPDMQEPDKQTRALEGQLRECYGRVAYSHKVHEKCADIYHSRLRRLKLAQIILSAITTGSLIVTLFGDNNVSTIIAAITATMLLAVNTYTKEHDLGELAQKHATAASDLWEVRESYLSLLTDIAGRQADLRQIRTARDALQVTLKSIYEATPRTLPEGYSAAQKALQVNEELTFSEQEIDNILPYFLRRAEKKSNGDPEQSVPADS